MIWYHCRSCLVTYDGFAQCCPDLDHMQFEVASDEEVSDVELDTASDPPGLILNDDDQSENRDD